MDEEIRAPFKKAAVTTDTLNLIEPFKRLDRDAQIEAVRYCEGRRYARGKSVISYQDTTRDVFWIVSGKLHVAHFSSGGKTVSLQDLGEGAMFGEISAIDGGPRSTNVVTLVESFLIRMTGERFLELVYQYPCFCQATLLRLTSMTRHLGGKVFESHALPVKHRIRLELFRIVQALGPRNPPVDISPAPKDYEIAHRVGTTREAVNRELNRLPGVERDGRRMVIADPPALLDELEHVNIMPPAGAA